MISDRTLAWFGDKSREELLAEIDRIITTDKPALAALYERLDNAERDNQTLRDGIEDYLLWEPGRRGHAEAHRRLAALVSPPAALAEERP